VDRFDDVDFKILEEPEPRRPRRRSPRFASFVTVTVAAGLFAASALASSNTPVSQQTPTKATKFEKRYGHGCKKGKRHHDRGGSKSLDLRY
jgi:uncharacterized membrane protein